MTEKRCVNCMRKLTGDNGACPHCGFDCAAYKPPEQTLPPGTTLNHGKYVIGRVLGRGGFGVTYVALDTTLDLRVAVKECLPRNSAWRNDSGDAVQWGLSVPEQEIMLESFVKEARKMAKIDQIPGVVRVREYFYENETAYIVMDYVEGETLAQYLRRNGSLSAEECFRILAPAMDSLAQAHKRGLVHRDISPNNIMIETNGEKVWVLDLGAAKDLGSRLAAPNVSANTRIVGTPGYTPLEQYSPDGKIGPWTDVYAMSSTFFRCMTGQKLPSSTSRALKDETPELLRTIRGSVGAVLMKGLAQSPDDRYQSMTELRDALKTAIFPKPKFTKKPQKKHLLLASLVLIVLALIPLSIALLRLSKEPVASGGCGDNALWTLDKNGLLTISGTGNMEDYKDKPWDAPWQKYQDTILHVKILRGITYIGENAFYACGNLQSVEISNSVTVIAFAAFRSCSSLTSVKIPDSVKDIEWMAFADCESLTNINIPDGVTSIASGIFFACNSLASVTIPNGVTDIGNHAFFNCGTLTSVEIPDSVKLIESEAFASCANLKSVSVPMEISIASDAFDEHTAVEWRSNSSVDIIASGKCGAYASWTLDADGLLTIFGKGGMDSYWDDTSSVPWFNNKSAISKVNILDGITTIGTYAFLECTNLKSVEIADSVKEISYATFLGCSSLTSFTIPKRVKEISASTFGNCTSLTSVTIPHGVTTIGALAFENCTSLKDLVIPYSVTLINSEAFQNCSSLESVTIPNSVTYLDWFAFAHCTSLTTVEIPKSITQISPGVFADCVNLENVIIPDTITKIGESAFRNCTSLNSISIPANASFFAMDGSNCDLSDIFSENTAVVRVQPPVEP